MDAAYNMGSRCCSELGYGIAGAKQPQLHTPPISASRTDSGGGGGANPAVTVGQKPRLPPGSSGKLAGAVSQQHMERVRLGKLFIGEGEYGGGMGPEPARRVTWLPQSL